MTTCIDKADDEWLAPQSLQLKRLAGDVAERVLADHIADSALAYGKGSVAIIVLLRRSRHRCPEKGKRAKYGEGMVACSLYS
ncbi:MAG: hypothetical protein OEM51_13325 [Gammaproteobacteria bacterium]|nr:hypothetical protein [Gammaproteobacteria bacterium]